MERGTAAYTWAVGLLHVRRHDIRAGAHELGEFDEGGAKLHTGLGQAAADASRSVGLRRAAHAAGNPERDEATEVHARDDVAEALLRGDGKDLAQAVEAADAAREVQGVHAR